MNRSYVLSVVVAFLLAISAAPAATLAVDPTGIVSSSDTNAFTTGWAFTILSPITVTGLGYLDAGGNGLLTAHDVGIFSSGGSLLVSTTVPSGIGASLRGNYRVAGIVAYELLAGSYVIGGHNPSGGADPGAYGVGAINSALEITVGATGLYAFGGALAFPSSSAGAGINYMSPNFEFDQIPEPATWTLAGGALALLGVVGRLSRKRG